MRALKEKQPRFGFYQEISQSNVQTGPGVYVNKQTCTNGNCTQGWAGPPGPMNVTPPFMGRPPLGQWSQMMMRSGGGPKKRDYSPWEDLSRMFSEERRWQLESEAP